MMPLAEILVRLSGHDYKISTDGEYKKFDLNLVGVRSKEKIADRFNDWLYVFWMDEDKWEFRSYQITTLPGKPWLKNPMNVRGTAILVPGQYLKSYKLGTYKGYTALKQISPVTVYRDFSKDLNYDMDSGTRDTGMFGIHIHRASLWNKSVGVSSAGCQVFQNRDDYDEFIMLCENAKDYGQERLTYTLLDELL